MNSQGGSDTVLKIEVEEGLYTRLNYQLNQVNQIKEFDQIIAT